MIVRSPEPGGVLLPGEALRVGFRITEGADALAARLLVDGEDVTEACLQRVAPTFPASRVELLYTPEGGWEPGPHEAAVVLGGSSDTWAFAVS
jgi:hypothetical protein